MVLADGVLEPTLIDCGRFVSKEDGRGVLEAVVDDIEAVDEPVLDAAVLDELSPWPVMLKY